MAQNIHFYVPGNCGLLGQCKGACNFHHMMQKAPAVLLSGAAAISR
jgi:hypothetical protein